MIADPKNHETSGSLAGAAPLGNATVYRGTVGGGYKANSERIAELEKRVLELETFRYEALELFHNIGRVFSLNAEVNKRHSSAIKP